MHMRRLLKTLFTQADPATDELVERVKAQSAATVLASNRLHDTISELLARNDQVTFRRRPNAQKSGN